MKTHFITTVIITGILWLPLIGHAISGNGSAGNPVILEHLGTAHGKSNLKLQQANLVAAARSEGMTVSLRPGRVNRISLRGTDLTNKQSLSGGKGLVSKGKGDPAHNAIVVLDRMSDLLAVEEAEKQFLSYSTKKDRLGFDHVRVKQVHNGLKVVGADLIVHFDKSGSAYQVNGSYVSDIDIATDPAIEVKEAVRIARKHLVRTEPGQSKLSAEPELVVFAYNVSPALCYEFTLTTTAGPRKARGVWRYWINAVSGDVVCAYNDVKDIAAPTSNGSNSTISGAILSGEGGATKSVMGWYENTGNYYLYNKVRKWYLFNDAISGYTDNNTYAYRTTSNWSSTDPVEMSGAFGFDETQKYFKDVHSLNSYDNANTYARANLHVGSSYVNAYWDPDLQQFFFGDGTNGVANPLTVMDVIAHEYTHAVTEHSADLIYLFEPGALNESFSDIFGACIEFASQPDATGSYPSAPAGQADWLMGEDCWISSTALRDMRNPRNTATVGSGNEQPSRYYGSYWWQGYGDNGGVHFNSGVQNFFFYLLCEGGSGNNDGITYNVSGINITNAEHVAYRALTVYSTSTTDYRDVRDAWISAAADLNPAWVSSVESAWDAVGVKDTPGYLVEFFDTFNFDLDNHSITFTPDASPESYSVHAAPIASLPVDPSGSTSISMGDDDSKSVSLTGGKTVKLYGVSYSSFYIGSNGFLTFGSPDINYETGIAKHLSLPRISALYIDLNPSSGGTVKWTQLSDRMVVTFTQIHPYGGTEDNTFQYELFFDGRIRISWLGINYPIGVVGLSDGSGMPQTFLETDFSIFANDYDQDGMPNSWELLYFSNVTNASPTADGDNDNFTNLEEYISGTHPLQASSFFQFTGSSLPAGGTDLIMNWNSVSGRKYNVYRKDNLIIGTPQLLQSGILYPQNSYTTTVNTVQDENFYFIEVEMQ